MRARRAIVTLLVVIGCGVAALLGSQPRPAAAVTDDGDHRAVVVVDLGNGDVRSACVKFRQASISGLDLLRAAHMDPVVQAYSGEGGAVCKLCGLGCEAGSSCLTCQSPKYWQYWRSDGGSGSYTYSGAGAGSAQVTDGDVDGWSWGSAKHPPPFLTVAEACSGPNVYRFEGSSTATTSTTPAPSTAPSTTALTSTTVGGGKAAAGETTTTRRPASQGSPGSTVRGALAGAPTTSPVLLAAPPAGVTTTTAGSPTSTPSLAARAPTSTQRRSAPRSSTPALVLLAALLTAIIGRTLQLRRRGRA